jgi:hypothetical protein
MANSNVIITYFSRGQTINPGQGIQLRAQFRDSNGDPVDLDSFPSITLQQPSGNISLGPTSSGISKISTGLYEYLFPVSISPSVYGVWVDRWQGNLNGLSVFGEFNFVVADSQIPRTNSDGYVALGDDPGFHYSQPAIHNINLLLHTLKARLNSSGMAKSKDQYGNDTYINCDVFSMNQLVSFLASSLSSFNQIPHTTSFDFSDDQFISIYMDILVQGAALMALSSQALIERGREYSVSDNGITVAIPTLSEMLNTQWSGEMTAYNERLKAIKGSMKPSPVSMGLISIQTAGLRNPLLSQLRHRRAKQIF